MLLAITALCWGSTPILEKVGLKEVDPFVGVTVRSMAITAVLLAVAALMRPGPSELIYTETAPRKPSETELPGKGYCLFKPLGTLWAVCAAASLLVYFALRRWLTLRGPVG